MMMADTTMIEKERMHDSNSRMTTDDEDDG